MKPLREAIETAMRRFPTVSSADEIVAFLADILRSRRDEIDSEWHLSTTDEASWRQLRSRRVQVQEDIEVLTIIYGVLQGNPLPPKKTANREKPDSGYGEL